MFRKDSVQGNKKDETNESKLPLPSMEAYNIMREKHCREDIEHFVTTFTYLFDAKKGSLTDIQKGDSLLDNQEFLKKLQLISGRLCKALETRTPYSSLYGDLLQFKSQLQVMLRYYKNQIEQGQPIAMQFVAGFDGKPFARKTGVLNEEESEAIIRYNMNYTANDIMTNELEKITTFILFPFLADHSKDVNFSYLGSGT